MNTSDEQFEDLQQFDPGPVPDGLELDGDPMPKPIKTVTITISELAGKRISMTSSPSFNELTERLKAGEGLAGADALAFHTMAYVADKMLPKPAASQIVTLDTPRIIV